MPTSIISGTLSDPSGTAVAGATVSARIVPPGASRITDGSEITSSEVTTTDSSGNWLLTLERTSNISPANSYYAVSEVTSTGTNLYAIQVPDANSNVAAVKVQFATPGTAIAADTIAARQAAIADLNGTYIAYLQLAADPDPIIFGTITRDANGAATSAPVVWPNGTVGTYTADTVSTLFPGAVDAYHVTYGSPVTRTYTQPAVTRDTNGAVTTRPAIVVT